MWLITKPNPKIPGKNCPNFSCSSFKDIQTLISDDPTRFRKHYIFHRVRFANAFLRALTPGPGPGSESNSICKSQPLITLPGSENQIVVYFTSLRVVRRTSEDCRYVLSILRSFRVSIDERDLSADGRFREELQRILGIREKTKLSLPIVFIGGRYIGGAEEIRRLHENGELKSHVEGLPPATAADTCEVCDGHRFILCGECSGSHKCYSDKCGGFKACATCSQSGLISCPSCCSRAPL